VNNQPIVPLILKGVALAMGVAAVVLNILGTGSASTLITLLALGSSAWPYGPPEGPMTCRYLASCALRRGHLPTALDLWWPLINLVEPTRLAAAMDHLPCPPGRRRVKPSRPRRQAAHLETVGRLRLEREPGCM